MARDAKDVVGAADSDDPGERRFQDAGRVWLAGWCRVKRRGQCSCSIEATQCWDGEEVEDVGTVDHTPMGASSSPNRKRLVLCWISCPSTDTKLRQNPISGWGAELAVAGVARGRGR